MRPALIILSALLITALASPAGAQNAPPPRPISIKEAVALSVKQNRVLRSADADVEIAQGNELSANAPLDFEIDGHANYQRTRTVIVPGLQQQQPEFDFLHVDLAATQPLSFGGRFGVLLQQDFTRSRTIIDFMGVNADATADSWITTAQLTYFMPLLKGLGADNYLGQRRIAAAAVDAATAAVINTTSNVVRDTVQAYWELAYAEKEVDIRKSALNLAREQLRVTQAQLDVGVGAPTDLAEVRQTIATREEDLLLSELQLSERALDVRQLTSLAITANDIALTPTDAATPQMVDTTLEQALATAAQNNPQLAVIRAQGRQAKITVDVNENGLLPQLDLNAAFGPTGAGESFGDAVDSMVNFDRYRLNVGLTLIAPVQRRLAKGQVAAARGNLHKVQIGEEDLLAQINVTVTRAVDLLKSTQKRLAVDAEAIQLAQVNLDAERARFDVGRSTNFDVLLRQDALSQAQLRRIRAGADYMKAVAVLRSLTGELLGVYGITVKPASR